jgi:hypothetical protein
MNYKNAAALIALATFFFAPIASAQEKIGGIFYSSCGPADGAAVTMELDNHLRITVFKASLVADEAYRTPAQVFEGEQPSMSVEICDSEMTHCKSVEGLITTYKSDTDTIEAALEYFDGTETQGDAESIQGHMAYFTVHRDKDHAKPPC